MRFIPLIRTAVVTGLILLGVFVPLNATIYITTFSKPAPYFSVDQATKDQVEKKLNSTVVKEYKGEGNLEQLLDYINGNTGALAVRPDPTAIRLLLRLYSPPASPGGSDKGKVDLDLHNVSLTEVVTLITQKWPVRYRIEDNAVVFFAADKTEADLDKYEEIERKFVTLFVDGVKYQKVDIEDVLKDISEKSKKNDPQHTGIHFVLRVPTAGSPPPANNSNWKLRREISILLLPPPSDPLPLADLLGYVCQQANLLIKIEKDDIALIPPPRGI